MGLKLGIWVEPEMVNQESLLTQFLSIRCGLESLRVQNCNRVKTPGQPAVQTASRMGWNPRRPLVVLFRL